MPILQVHVDDKTHARLTQAATELGRTVMDLAEAAVAEAALDYDRHRPRALTVTFCSICREPQFNTPAGITCKNGHGGAEPL